MENVCQRPLLNHSHALKINETDQIENTANGKDVSLRIASDSNSIELP